MKRACDFLFALCALSLLTVPLALIALVVWLEDRRSPFFLGRRVGREKREFRMLKFRTMRPDAWKSGVNSTALGDDRITRIGRVLRRFKLDELPQLWNVLSGDMSLVGPRPQVRTDAALYTLEERRMLSVRPGVTDLASIVFADEGEILSGSMLIGSGDPDLLYNQIIRPWKSRLALAYIDHASFRIDILIIALTLLSAVSRRRALRGVASILDSWNADRLLKYAALREFPLLAWPPPGATEIVDRYPKAKASGV